MFDVPLSAGADAFIWGFVLLIAFVVAIIVVDVFKENRNESVKSKDKRIL